MKPKKVTKLLDRVMLRRWNFFSLYVTRNTRRPRKNPVNCEEGPKIVTGRGNQTGLQMADDGRRVKCTPIKIRHDLGMLLEACKHHHHSLTSTRRRLLAVPVIHDAVRRLGTTSFLRGNGRTQLQFSSEFLREQTRILLYLIYFKST